MFGFYFLEVSFHLFLLSLNMFDYNVFPRKYNLFELSLVKEDFFLIVGN